jgi:hypothetical protein
MMLHSERRLMKVGDANGTNVADCGQLGRSGWIFGASDERCGPGGMVVGMIGGLEMQCRMAIPS